MNQGIMLGNATNASHKLKEEKIGLVNNNVLSGNKNTIDKVEGAKKEVENKIKE